MTRPESAAVTRYESGLLPRPPTGVKYGVLNAFWNSARNSMLVRSLTRIFFTPLISNRTSLGPATISSPTAQSPNPDAISIQSGPLAGAKYWPFGTPNEPYPLVDVALTL